MKKTNKLMLSLLLVTTTAPISQFSFAEENDSVAVENKEMSEIRTDIAKKKLENDFYAEELNLLQKKKNIEKIKWELNSETSSFNKDFEVKNLAEPFEEDILSYGLENQEVGFVYQEDFEKEEEKDKEVISEEDINNKINNIVADVMAEKEKDFEAKKLELEQQIQQLTEQQTMQMQNDVMLENKEEFVVKEILVTNFLQIGKSKKATLKIEYQNYLNNMPAKIGYEDRKIEDGQVFDLFDNTYKVLSLEKGKLKLLNITENTEMLVKF